MSAAAGTPDGSGAAVLQERLVVSLRRSNGDGSERSLKPFVLLGCYSMPS